MPSRVLVLLFTTCCSLSQGIVLHAQESICTHVLLGRVIDDHDRTPLEFAEVLLVGTDRGVVADIDGCFRLDGLCPGQITIRIAHLGCDPVERIVNVPRAQELVIRMEHHAHELREMEVVSKRPDEQVGHSHETVEADEMVRNAGAGIANMIGKVAGVTMLNSGPTLSKPVIHGLSGNRIVIMNQGVRQEDQQWGGEHAPNLDPFTTDRITVVKGAASVQYGSDALGGVIVTEPVPLPREGPIAGSFHGVGIANGRGGAAGLQLQGGLGNWRGFGWRVQASGRYLGDSEAARYVLSNTGDREAGASASFGYRDHRFSSTVYYSRFDRQLGILRAAHIGSLSDLRAAIATGEPWFVADRTYAIDVPRQTMTHHLMKAEVGYAITERSRIVATYGYQLDDRKEFDLRRGGRSGTPALDLDLRVHSGDLVLKHWIGPQVHGRVGVSGSLQQNINVPGTGVRPLIPNYRRGNIGAFVIEHVPLSERLELEAGLRLEASKLEVAKFDANDVLINPVHEFTNGAFHAGMAWTLKDSTLVRFGVGSAYRPPHVSELYSEGLHHGAAAIEQGDPDLESERSLSATAEVDGSWADGRLTARLGLRSDRIDDMIYLRPDGTRLTIRGAFPVFQYVATNAVLHSADAQLGTCFGRRLKVDLRFNTVRAHDRGTGGWLFLMPSDRAAIEFTYTTIAKGKWEPWEFMVRGTQVLEQRRVSSDIDLDAPPPGYTLCDLSIGSGRTMGKDRLRFGVQVNNLFNAAYRDYLDRFRYFADARGTDVRLWFGYAFGSR